MTWIIPFQVIRLFQKKTFVLRLLSTSRPLLADTVTGRVRTRELVINMAKPTNYITCANIPPKLPL